MMLGLMKYEGNDIPPYSMHVGRSVLGQGLILRPIHDFVVIPNGLFIENGVVIWANMSLFDKQRYDLPLCSGRQYDRIIGMRQFFVYIKLP